MAASIASPRGSNGRARQITRGFPHWRWHLDEMYVKLNGEMVYLWRAVDHEGEVLESYVTNTRNKKAALSFMKTALNALARDAKVGGEVERVGNQKLIPSAKNP